MTLVQFWEIVCLDCLCKGLTVVCPCKQQINNILNK